MDLHSGLAHIQYKETGSAFTSLRLFPITWKASSFLRIGPQVSLNEMTPCTRGPVVWTASAATPIAEGPGSALMPWTPTWSFISSLFPSNTDFIFRHNFAALAWFAVSRSNFMTRGILETITIQCLPFEGPTHLRVHHERLKDPEWPFLPWQHVYEVQDDDRISRIWF